MSRARKATPAAGSRARALSAASRTLSRAADWSGLRSSHRSTMARAKASSAQAWALLAFARAIVLLWLDRSPDQSAARDKVRDAADKALALDPAAGVAFLAVSYTH